MGREARAAVAAAESVWLTLPVTKVDQANWRVTGVVTSETVDHQGEIVDYEAAKALFTDGSWPGNIREMHKADAVGKRVSVECDDVTKTIALTAQISKGAPQTWAKVLDGTLSMYSLGGKAAKRVVEKIAAGATATRMYLGQLVEVSLVDNAANPESRFDIVKSVDGQLVDAQPPEPDDPIAKAAIALVDAVTKAADDKEKHKTASGAEGKKYAGVDGKSYPISEPVDVHNAAKDIGRCPAADRAETKANIIKIAYELGKAYVAELPEPWKKAADQKAATVTDVVKSGGMEPWDIDSILGLISGVERLMSTEMWEARSAAASDGHKNGPEVAQVAMLKAACDALLHFLQSEYEEQFEGAPATGDPNPSGDLDAGDLEAALVSADDVVELFLSSLALVQKAGARHSKGDVGMIQQVHDLASSLGADCAEDTTKMNDTQTPAAETVEKAKGDCPDCKGSGDCAACDGSGKKPAAKAVDPTDVQKLTAEIETLKADAAEKAKAHAEVEKRLKAVEDQPVGGGPAKTAVQVDKALGAGSATPEAGDEAVVAKAMQDLVDANPGSDLIREQVAKATLSRQFQAGTNRITFGR
jgi:hypothetical protein